MFRDGLQQIKRKLYRNLQPNPSRIGILSKQGLSLLTTTYFYMFLLDVYSKSFAILGSGGLAKKVSFLTSIKIFIHRCLFFIASQSASHRCCPLIWGNTAFRHFQLFLKLYPHSFTFSVWYPDFVKSRLSPKVFIFTAMLAFGSAAALFFYRTDNNTSKIHPHYRYPHWYVGTVVLFTVQMQTLQFLPFLTSKRHVAVDLCKQFAGASSSAHISAHFLELLAFKKKQLEMLYHVLLAKKRWSTREGGVKEARWCREVVSLRQHFEIIIEQKTGINHVTPRRKVSSSAHAYARFRVRLVYTSKDFWHCSVPSQCKQDFVSKSQEVI